MSEVTKVAAELEERAARIQGLRELADWLEAHSEVPFDKYDSVGVIVYGADRWQVAAVARAAGNAEKQYFSSTFELKKLFAGGVRYEINAPREEVCTKRVIGTEDVPECVIPAHTREIVEWDCVPLLAPSED